jgi:hypothetical protein
MARIPKRLVGPAQVATGPTTVYTVPAVTKTVIRHIHVNNPSAGAVTITLSIGADAAGTRILDAYSIPAKAAGVTGSVVDFFCYYVMEVGEILTASSGTNNTLTLTVDGDEIVLG